MPKFNPDFWEVPVPPEYFEQFSTEDYLRYQPFVDAHTNEYRAKQQQVLQQIRQIIGNELTAQQARCVQLYFYEGKTQEEIGNILGIRRRVVSQHLFGVTRNGKQVGGAIKKIRKRCRRLGIQL
ncbi:MAG: hypothetical protein OXP71_02425 [Candidatus Poribacteria bacterium]|nr:hypothetical protein [Candidatus Poribacteria bacterium]